MKHLFEELQDQAAHMAQQVEDGYETHLDGLIFFHDLERNSAELIELAKRYKDYHELTLIEEIASHNGEYRGFDIRHTNGREVYSFKNIPEFMTLEEKRKEIEDKFKHAYKGIGKSTQLTKDESGKTFWVDADGTLQPLPEVKNTKGFITVKEKKQ